MHRRLRYFIVKKIAPNLYKNAMRCYKIRPFTRQLGDLNKTLIGAEIGVYRGENAQEILKYTPTILLYLIDPYEEYEDAKSWNRISLKEAEKEAHERLKNFSQVHWIPCKSENIIEWSPFDKLDFVYIDGNHTTFHVKKDIELALKITKEGAIIGGHDYFGFYSVKEVVDAYSLLLDVDLYTESPDWWFFKNART